MDEGRKRVLLIAASILASRKLAHWDGRHPRRWSPPLPMRSRLQSGSWQQSTAGGRHGARDRIGGIVFVGYMDESYDGSAVPKVFNLSCLVSHVSTWVYFEWAWLKVLGDKNRELRNKGRKELSRFHAKDINNFQGEYEDWTSDERLDFCAKLTEVFKRNPAHIHGWDMPLQILVEEIPETLPNPIGFAYIVLLGELMQQIGETTLSLPSYRQDLISLHHDACKHDASLLEWFNLLLEDKSFRFRERYVSITPEHWQSCIPLQPADLVAYENFKEGMRFHVKDSKEAKRNRMRRSLEAPINLDSISGRARAYTREMIQALKEKLDKDSESKKALFKAARINERV